MYTRNRRVHNQLTRASHPDVRHAGDLSVEQTYVVDGPKGTGILHYEIIFVPDGRRSAPRLTVLTRNAALYQQALDAEGNASIRFEVTYHASQRPDGTPCRVVDGLEMRRA